MMVKQASLLVRTLREAAKTSDHFAIPCRRLVHFGQNHAFGGLHSGLLGVFREFEFRDRTMKTGETLCVVSLFGHLLPFAGTRKQGTVHKVIAMTVRVALPVRVLPSS
jgi:hypothetical protein